MEMIDLVTLDQEVPDNLTLAQLRGWARDFLMKDNPQLGREGHVCPFSSFGARLNTLRFGVSECSPGDAPLIRRQLRNAFEQFEEIAHPKGKGVYRAILIAFPNCHGRSGVAALARAQKSLRLTSFLKARMIGVFYPEAPEPGLWNRDFRPLRAPVPLVAIRSLVTADAAFVMRHPLLAPAYLCNFPIAGPRELMALRLRKA
jgi:hypothetical protein